MKLKFLAVCYSVTHGWNLADHAQIFPSLRLAKEWIEENHERQYELLQAHNKKREDAIAKLQRKYDGADFDSRLRPTLKRFQEKQPWWFESAEVYEIHLTGTMSFIDSYSTESKDGKDGSEAIGWGS